MAGFIRRTYRFLRWAWKINLLWAGRGLEFAVRMEAFYQHYARSSLLSGYRVMSREDWFLLFVEDPEVEKFATRVLLDPEYVLEGAEGSQI